MNALDFLPLEKAVDASSVNDLALTLGVNRRQVMHWRSVGVTMDEAVMLAERAGFDVGEIWPDLNGRPAPEAEGGEAPPASSEDGDGIVWCDPPGPIRQGHKGRWPDLLSPLVDRPGEWARIAVYSTKSSANTLRTRLKKKPPLPGRWEFTQRLLPDRTSGVWARYLGPETAE